MNTISGSGEKALSSEPLPHLGLLAWIKSGAFTLPSSLVRKRVMRRAPPGAATLRPFSLTSRISPAAAWGIRSRKEAL